MSVEDGDAYRRAIEAISRGDANALDALLAFDIADHNGTAGQPLGRDGFTH